MTEQEQTEARTVKRWQVGRGDYIAMDWWLTDDGKNLTLTREDAADYLNVLEARVDKAEGLAALAVRAQPILLKLSGAYEAETYLDARDKGDVWLAAYDAAKAQKPETEAQR